MTVKITCWKRTVKASASLFLARITITAFSLFFMPDTRCNKYMQETTEIMGMIAREYRNLHHALLRVEAAAALSYDAFGILG